MTWWQLTQWQELSTVYTRSPLLLSTAYPQLIHRASTNQAIYLYFWKVGSLWEDREHWEHFTRDCSHFSHSSRSYVHTEPEKYRTPCMFFNFFLYVYYRFTLVAVHTNVYTRLLLPTYLGGSFSVVVFTIPLTTVCIWG